MLTGIPFAEIRTWLFDHALPLWADRGFDHTNGVFRERLGFDAEPADPGFLRTRVLARQIYVYCQAVELGWSGPALERAEQTYAFLARHAWLAPEQHWARKMSPSGAIIDDVADLYDHAFMLFALGWLQKTAPNPRYQAGIGETLSAIENNLASADGLGFREAQDADIARREQNPHMHVLEALIVVYEADPAPRYRDAAMRIYELYCDRIVDQETGALREFFAPGWKWQDTPEGRFVEPGHQMEWVWILNRFARLFQVDTDAVTRALFAFAETHGIEPVSGLTFDGVDTDGARTKPSFRSWPQTETLKAHLARFEADGEIDQERVRVICRNLLDRYLCTEIPGLWIDQLDRHRQPVSDFVPASTLYHVVLAFAELLRLEARIKDAAA